MIKQIRSSNKGIPYLFYLKDFYKEILHKENVFNDYEIELINNPLKRILTEDKLAKNKENKLKDKNNKNKK